jgi:RNA polymerase primary sigma factor
MARLLTDARGGAPRAPKFVDHAALHERNARVRFAESSSEQDVDFERGYMPDEVTRERARCMHYAAYRAHKAKTREHARRWCERYYRLRDSIVLGNRKLIFKAVRRCSAAAQFADDLIGDCHLVLINAVAVYNPWLGVRFSTYAYTCLIRALSRQSQRLANDRLSRALALNVATDAALGVADDPTDTFGLSEIDSLLRDEHPLLSPREKMIIRRRYILPSEQPMPTLEKVGREMGLSKERVRQVQALALDKLRSVLI